MKLKQIYWLSVSGIVGGLVGVAFVLSLQQLIRQPTSTSYSTAIQSALPFSVTIVSNQSQSLETSAIANDPFFSELLPHTALNQTSLGSGILLNQDGWVVTNAHVVAEAQEIFVVTSSQELTEVTETLIDPATDIAFLKTNLTSSLPTPISSEDLFKVGDLVFTIGNPFGIGQSVSMGIVSALDRTHPSLSTLNNFIQTDAAVNPGNSGGPLINYQGEIIGMNSAIFSSSGGSQGIGFAIPFSQITAIFSELQSTGSLQRGYMGIDVEELLPAELAALDLPSAVRITSVQTDGPADIAGLLPGDLILEMNGSSVSSRTELVRTISRLMAGNQTELTIMRAQQKARISVTLAAKREP